MNATKSLRTSGTANVLEAAKPRNVKVLIVDDHATMREGLIRVLEREPNLQVCGETDSAHRALEMISSTKSPLFVYAPLSPDKV